MPHLPRLTPDTAVGASPGLLAEPVSRYGEVSAAFLGAAALAAVGAIASLLTLRGAPCGIPTTARSSPPDRALPEHAGAGPGGPGPVCSGSGGRAQARRNVSTLAAKATGVSYMG
jgi:hypothetical protein